jgi:glutaredoxin
VKVLIGLLVLASCQAGAQQIHRWIDADGRIRYTSEKPPGVQSTVVQPRISAAPDRPTAAPARPEVVMYATDWCPYCKQARQYFARQGIAYREVDIEKSPAGRAEYNRLGGRGVPLIMVGAQRMQGYREESLARLLKSAGY